MTIVIAMATAACSGSTAPGGRQAALEAAPPPVTSTAPVDAAPAATRGADERFACDADSDCEIWSSCCAYCFENGTVVSLSKKFAAYGSLLTFTLYCPSCAEGGCTMSPPKRTAICKAGTCARRDTTIDPTGKVVSVEVDNDPAQLEPREEIELFATAMHHACLRVTTCNRTATAACDELILPQRSTCAAAKRCYEAIDQMKCPAAKTFDFGVLDAVSKLPDCEEAMRACVNPTPSTMVTP